MTTEELNELVALRIERDEIQAKVRNLNHKLWHALSELSADDREQFFAEVREYYYKKANGIDGKVDLR